MTGIVIAASGALASGAAFTVTPNPFTLEMTQFGSGTYNQPFSATPGLGTYTWGITGASGAYIASGQGTSGISVAFPYNFGFGFYEGTLTCTVGGTTVSVPIYVNMYPM